MLEKLSEVLKRTTDKIANAIFLDKNLIDSIVKDLQRALIEADVNIHLVKRISDDIKKAAFDERIKEIDNKEHIINLLHEELLKILGEQRQLKISKESQNRIMLLGLYGAGKTTTIAKLGNYFAKRGNKVALVGLDVHRPAAAEQLKQLAEKNNLDYLENPEKEKEPLKIWENHKKKLEKYNIVLIDTAGRHSLDSGLIEELRNLEKTIIPTESILVMPADIGQAAKNQSQEFQKAVKITGVIITRMDSTAKAGGVLTACSETGAGIYFIATGEKINDIEEFNPDSFLSRLLGMGDLKTLIEKIKSVTKEDNQKEIQQRIEEGKLTIEDMIEQVKSMSSLGGFDKIMSMIPGMPGIGAGKKKLPEGILENQEAKVAKWEHIAKSMTNEEKNNPEILEKQSSRISRISKGAGVPASDIRSMLKQHKMLSEIIKGGIGDMQEGQMLSQKQMMKIAKKFGKRKMMKF